MSDSSKAFRATFIVCGSLMITMVFAAFISVLVGKAESRQPQQARIYMDDILILTDHETGCQYVRQRHAGGAALVPRISPDGKSIMGCNGGKL